MVSAAPQEGFDGAPGVWAGDTGASAVVRGVRAGEKAVAGRPGVACARGGAKGSFQAFVRQ